MATALSNDLNGLCNFINPAALDILGFTKEEAVGQDLHKLIHHVQDESMILYDNCPVHLTLKDGKRRIAEVCFTRKNGERFPARLTVTPTLQGNEIVGVTGIFQDITERKNAEKQIHFLNQIYACLSQTNETIVRCQDETTLFREVCRIAVEFGGMEMSWIGRKDEDSDLIIPVSKYGSGVKYLDGIAISSRADVFEGQGSTGSAFRENRVVIVQDFNTDIITVPWQKRAKKYGWGASASFPISRNGRTYAVFSVYHKDKDAFNPKIVDLLKQMAFDISYALDMLDVATKRMTVEKQNEAKYRLIADNTSDLICVLDINGVVLYMSPSYHTVMGFSPEKCEGQFVFNFIHAEDVAEVKQQFLAMLQTKETTKMEFRQLHSSGRWVDVEAKSTPVADEFGNVENIVIIARDITERKQTQEQLLRSEKLAIVGELAAGVAHEIRNPLTSLKGFLQLLSQREENKGYCSIMLPELDRIDAIVSELLMVAKPQAQNLKPTCIQRLLNHVIELLSTNAIMSNVQITFSYDENISLVSGDENQLKQVFINILKNAIDAMPNGGEVSVEAQKYDENSVMIRVMDRGCGIPKERLAKVGEPFYTTKEKGTGLGLMVSKRIIEMHNGKILITSEEGIGTTVEIGLPVVFHD